jgi:hypothetical protein
LWWWWDSEAAVVIRPESQKILRIASVRAAIFTFNQARSEFVLFGPHCASVNCPVSTTRRGQERVCSRRTRQRELEKSSGLSHTFYTTRAAFNATIVDDDFIDERVGAYHTHTATRTDSENYLANFNHPRLILRLGGMN